MKTSYKLIIGLLVLFIFTVTFYFAQTAYNTWQVFQKPIVNPINLPDGSETIPVPSTDIITIFPIGNSDVYFETKDKSGILKIDSKEFTSLIENQEKIIGKSKFTIVIKSTKTAKYKDMVDLLDELTLLKIKRYSILGIADDENKRIEAYLNNQLN